MPDISTYYLTCECGRRIVTTNKEFTCLGCGALGRVEWAAPPQPVSEVKSVEDYPWAKDVPLVKPDVGMSEVTAPSPVIGSSLERSRGGKRTLDDGRSWVTPGANSILPILAWLAYPERVLGLQIQSSAGSGGIIMHLRISKSDHADFNTYLEKLRGPSRKL